MLYKNIMFARFLAILLIQVSAPALGADTKPRARVFIEVSETLHPVLVEGILRNDWKYFFDKNLTYWSKYRVGADFETVGYYAGSHILLVVVDPDKAEAFVHRMNQHRSPYFGVAASDLAVSIDRNIKPQPRRISPP